MSSKPEFKEVADKVMECLKEVSEDVEEVHVYPVFGGFRVEVYRRHISQLADRLKDCVMSKTGYDVNIKYADERTTKLLVMKRR